MCRSSKFYHWFKHSVFESRSGPSEFQPRKSASSKKSVCDELLKFLCQICITVDRQRVQAFKIWMKKRRPNLFKKVFQPISPTDLVSSFFWPLDKWFFIFWARTTKYYLTDSWTEWILAFLGRMSPKLILLITFIDYFQGRNSLNQLNQLKPWGSLHLPMCLLTPTKSSECLQPVSLLFEIKPSAYISPLMTNFVL